MKKVLTGFFLTSLIAALVLAAPAFACACGPLTSGHQQGSAQGSGKSGHSHYNPSEPCTWPPDIRPASCTPQSPAK
jgi:hypothetical protein